MNDKIQELLVEAHRQTKGGIYNGHPSAWSEKFAELIVKECADLIDNVLEPGSPPNLTIGEQLVKHFGVSEQDKVVAKHKCSVCGTTEKVKYMGGYQPYLCDSVDCIPY